ncbi:hypothetical protein ACLB2K_007302 [Fragaria x ananassa]
MAAGGAVAGAGDGKIFYPPPSFPQFFPSSLLPPSRSPPSSLSLSRPAGLLPPPSLSRRRLLPPPASRPPPSLSFSAASSLPPSLLPPISRLRLLPPSPSPGLHLHLLPPPPISRSPRMSGFFRSKKSSKGQRSESSKGTSSNPQTTFQGQMTARRASLLETAPEVPISSRQAAVPRSSRLTLRYQQLVKEKGFESICGSGFAMFITYQKLLSSLSWFSNSRPKLQGDDILVIDSEGSDASKQPNAPQSYIFLLYETLLSVQREATQVSHVWWLASCVGADPQINLLNEGCSQYNATSLSDFYTNLNATFLDLKAQLLNGSKHFATAQQAKGSDPVYAMTHV